MCLLHDLQWTSPQQAAGYHLKSSPPLTGGDKGRVKNIFTPTLPSPVKGEVIR